MLIFSQKLYLKPSMLEPHNISLSTQVQSILAVNIACSIFFSVFLKYYSTSENPRKIKTFSVSFFLQSFDNIFVYSHHSLSSHTLKIPLFFPTLCSWLKCFLLVEYSHLFNPTCSKFMIMSVMNNVHCV